MEESQRRDAKGLDNDKYSPFIQRSSKALAASEPQTCAFDDLHSELDNIRNDTAIPYGFL